MSRLSRSALPVFLALPLLCGLAFSVLARDNEPKAVIEQAIQQYKAGDYDQAVQSLGKVLASDLSDECSEKAFLLQAETLLRSGRPLQAHRILSLFLGKFPSSEYLGRAKYQDAVALVRSGEIMEGVRALCRLHASAPPHPIDSLVLAGLHNYAYHAATVDELLFLESSFPENPDLVSIFRFAGGEKYYKSRNYAEAADAFEKVIQHHPRHPRIDDAQRYLADARKKSSSLFRVAILVPLEGEYRTAGVSVRKGVELAFRQFNARGGRQIYWKAFNTAGSPVTTVLLLRNLLKEGKAQAIVGPLLSPEVVAAGAAMGTRSIPILTPTATDQNITRVCPSLYQIPVPPHAAAGKIAQYAVEVLNIHQFAVVSPLNEYGKIMTRGFLEQLERMGARCLVVQYYQEGQTHFRSVFKKIREKYFEEQYYQQLLDSGIVAWDDSLLASAKRRAARDDTTEVYAGGLFFPCNEEDVVGLTSQADHYLVKGQLLGTASWYSRNAIRKNTKAVEGAIIGVDFLPEAHPESWESFSRAFEKKAGSKPDRIAGQAYDTGRLLCLTLEQSKGRLSSADLNARLKSTLNFRGVCGSISFDPATRTNHDIVILRILGGSFVRVQ